MCDVTVDVELYGGGCGNVTVDVELYGGGGGGGMDCEDKPSSLFDFSDTDEICEDSELRSSS